MIDSVATEGEKEHKVWVSQYRCRWPDESISDRFLFLAWLCSTTVYSDALLHLLSSYVDLIPLFVFLFFCLLRTVRQFKAWMLWLAPLSKNASICACAGEQERTDERRNWHWFILIGSTTTATLFCIAHQTWQLILLLSIVNVNITCFSYISARHACWLCPPASAVWAYNLDRPRQF